MKEFLKKSPESSAYLGREGIPFSQSNLETILEVRGLASEGFWSQAKQKLEPFLLEPTQRLGALIELGHVLRSAEQHLEAAKAFESAYREAPHNLDLWTLWCDSSFAAGDGNGLMRAFETVAEVRPIAPEDLVEWASKIAEAGLPDQALHFYTEALQRAPENMAAICGLAGLLLSQEHYQDAAHLYETALRLDPSQPHIWLGLSECMAALGHAERSETCLLQANILSIGWNQAA